MTKNNIISGRYVAPGTIKIMINNGQQLVDGQKVLVYRPTDKEIVNCSTGRLIGKKEKVLASGTVSVKEGQPVIITSKNKSIAAVAHKANSYQLVTKPIVGGKKIIKSIINTDVLIKPIME